MLDNNFQTLANIKEKYDNDQNVRRAVALNQGRGLYCTSCHKVTIDPLYRGNIWIEIILWLCYIIPGLIYSIWRRSGQPNICPNCRKETLIPAASTSMEKGNPIEEVQRDEVECPWCAEMILAKANKCKHCGSDVRDLP